MSLLYRLMIIAVLAAAAWWALSRGRRPAALQALSVAALGLAVAAVVVEGLRWQLVPWQVVAVAVATAAALRRWRPGHFGRWRRVMGRSVLVIGLAVGALLVLLTEVVPALPKPAGPHRVGSEIFRWTDRQRPETLTANRSDRRQVIAQPGIQPTRAPDGQRRTSRRKESSRSRWAASQRSCLARSAASQPTPLSILRAPSAPGPCCCSRRACSCHVRCTRRCADLASRGYVVVALSAPYESGLRCSPAELLSDRRCTLTSRGRRRIRPSSA